jgi:hypothetical protein
VDVLEVGQVRLQIVRLDRGLRPRFPNLKLGISARANATGTRASATTTANNRDAQTFLTAFSG